LPIFYGKILNMKGKLLLITTLLLGLPALLIFYAFRVEPNWLQEKHIEARNSKIPASFSGTKIVFLTDIHYGDYFGRDRTARLVERVNKLKPDLILLGGDYVTFTYLPKWDMSGPSNVSACFEELGKLRAPLGVFGVLGNHDYYPYADLKKRSIAAAGITLLDNKGAWIVKGKERIRIGGVGDLWRGTQDLEQTLKGTTYSDFVILLSHNPDYIEEIKPGLIDLMLSGHTHGGQISLFGLWAPKLPSAYEQKYRSGVIREGNTTLIISNGIGVTFPPARLFTPPQIVVVTLK